MSKLHVVPGIEGDPPRFGEPLSVGRLALLPAPPPGPSEVRAQLLQEYFAASGRAFAILQLLSKVSDPRERELLVELRSVHLLRKRVSAHALRDLWGVVVSDEEAGVGESSRAADPGVEAAPVRTYVLPAWLELERELWLACQRGGCAEGTHRAFRTERKTS